MKALDRTAVEAWAKARGYALNARALPSLRDAEELGSFKIPRDAGERVALVKRDMRAFSEQEEICVWLHDWDVWPSGQWHHLFDRFRTSYGIVESLFQCPAFLISGKDRDGATSVAIYATLMLWDCHVLSATGRLFVYYSHDEWGRKRT